MSRAASSTNFVVASAPLTPAVQRARLGSPIRWQQQASFSVMPADKLRKRVEEINERFVEAREEISYALEEEGTVYFEEEVITVRFTLHGSVRCRRLFTCRSVGVCIVPSQQVAKASSRTTLQTQHPSNNNSFDCWQAQAIADAALKMWTELLAELSDETQRTELQRSMGMKMEQLRAESKEMFDRLTDH